MPVHSQESYPLPDDPALGEVARADFGTGYSSLAVLAELPIDTLKIDKRFIDNIARTDEGRGFVQAIMHLARTLHLHTVAEGVEGHEQESALTQLGCTHVQGYLHSPPVPADRVAEYLERNSERYAECT
jgi:EAL domain-containing protein (putative c-di-GMP-specific phosphodiesterase class I)